MTEIAPKKFQWLRGQTEATMTAWRARWKWVVENKVKFPFLGHLTTVQLTDFWNAAVEYLHTLVWSTMPFWLGAGIIYIQATSGNRPIFDVFQGTFKNGELLVYTIGTLTPLTFHTLFEDPKGRFPHRLGIGTLAIIIIISCASLFALQKAGVKTKPELIYTCSVYFAFSAIALRYIAIVYNKTRVPMLKEPDFTSSTTSFNLDFDKAADRMEEKQRTSRDNNSIDAMTAAFDKADVPSAGHIEERNRG